MRLYNTNAPTRCSTGLDDSLANQDDNLLYAARLSFNFLNIEENPG